MAQPTRIVVHVIATDAGPLTTLREELVAQASKTTLVVGEGNGLRPMTLIIDGEDTPPESLTQMAAGHARDLVARGVDVRYAEVCELLSPAFAGAGPAYVVFAPWPVGPESAGRFAGAAVEDASLSLANEGGCLCFDVLRSLSARHLFFLHEAYFDSNAFDSHLLTPHFNEFIEMARPLYTGDRGETLKGTYH